ncbi:MAG: acetate--CoA ligase family protein, partial [Deltaproteobacteria bacterium]
LLMEKAFCSAKPILVHKSNTSDASSRIARSHTGSLSTSEEVVNAAFRQCGILRVTDMHSTIHALKAHSLPPMRGNRLAIVSRSGGHAVVAADAAANYGFALQPFPEEFLRMVAGRLRAGVIRLGNPMDLGDLFDLQFFQTIVNDTLARSDIDGMLVVYNYNGVFFEEDSRSLVHAIKEASQRIRKPTALCLVTSDEEYRLNRRNHPNFPMFTEPEEAVHALAVSRDFYCRQLANFAEAKGFAVEKKKAMEIVTTARARGDRQLTTPEAFQVLSHYGIPLAPWTLVTSAEETSDRAASLGFPVVMKVIGEEFIHKSDVGGVILSLNSESEVRQAYHHLVSLIQKTKPGETENGVLVQKMVSDGYEVFVGGKQDPTFGPVVVVGLGGVYVEVFQDVAFRVAPVGEDEAWNMLGEIRGARILQGIRGQPPADQNALTQIIQRLSQLVCDLGQIEEVDINPLKVLPQGRGCLGVDCRMVLSAYS